MTSEDETKRVTMNLPRELVSKLDVISRSLFKNRAEVTKEALREFVEKFEGDEEVRETAIEEYLNGELEYRGLETILGSYDAKAVETSRYLYDRGEDLAKTIVREL